jgi:hypothetical protein
MYTLQKKNTFITQKILMTFVWGKLVVSAITM